MKRKYIIYTILTIILLVPIVSIIVISIVSQPKTEYSEYFTDQSTLVTAPIKISNIKETIVVDAVFDSSYCNSQTVSTKNKSYEIYCEEGESIAYGDCICNVDSKDVYAVCGGIVKKIVEGDSRIIFKIKSFDVDRIIVPVPVELFQDIENSNYSMEYCGQSFTGVYIGCDPVSQGDNSFNVYYSIEGDGKFILNGTTSIKLTTGRIHENVLTVKKECVYKDDSNNYYIKLVDENDDISKVYVLLGIHNSNRVEITTADSNISLKKGMNTVIGDKNYIDSDEDEASSSNKSEELDE